MNKHIKGLTLLIVMLTSSVAHAQQQTPNAVYIDQIGDSSVISVTQVGDGNRVGQVDNRFDIAGDNMSVNIYQQGPRNILTGRIINADNTWAHIVQGGFDNTAEVNLGQIGDVQGSSLDLHVFGNGNITNFTQGAITSALDGQTIVHVTGDLNTINSTIEVDNAINNAYLNGNFNTITTNQTGFAGKNSLMNVTGDNNNIQVNQTSTFNVDTFQLNSVGSGSNIIINQCTTGPC